MPNGAATVLPLEHPAGRRGAVHGCALVAGEFVASDAHPGKAQAGQSRRGRYAGFVDARLEVRERGVSCIVGWR